MKCYSELMRYHTLEDRYDYLRTAQKVADVTFGGDRYLNQALYRSEEWRSFRHKIMIRDGGFDLGVEGYPVGDRWTIHHINPLTRDALIHKDDSIFDPENVILCSFLTHQYIHFGDRSQLPKGPIVRRPNDTCPWR